MSYGYGYDNGPIIVVAVALIVGILVVQGLILQRRRRTRDEVANQDRRAGQVRRTYTGRSHGDALAVFHGDAMFMERRGLVVVSENWREGQWGCGIVTLALLLVPGVLGIAMLLYLVAVRPEGHLEVVYGPAHAAVDELDQQPVSRTGPDAAPATPKPQASDRYLAGLASLRDRRPPEA